MKRWIETTLSIALIAAWAAVAITAHEATMQSASARPTAGPAVVATEAVPAAPARKV